MPLNFDFPSLVCGERQGLDPCISKGIVFLFQRQVHAVVENTQHGLVVGNLRAEPWEIRLVTNLISQGSAL